MEQKKKCLECGKTLKPIGDKRENGALHLTDWEGRKYHKNCWKKIQEKKNIERTIKKLYSNA